MKWPPNLLAREIVVEVRITADKQGKTRCIVSPFDDGAPVALVVQGMVECAKKLMDEADAMARQFGLKVTVTETGDVTIT